MHQFHRQVVGEVRRPLQRPVGAASFGIRIAERLADLVVLEVVDVGGGIHPVLVGEAHQAQQVVVGDLPVQGGAPETIVGFAATEAVAEIVRSEEHTSELQSLMRISYAVFCLNKKIKKKDKL